MIRLRLRWKTVILALFVFGTVTAIFFRHEIKAEYLYWQLRDPNEPVNDYSAGPRMCPPAEHASANQLILLGEIGLRRARRLTYSENPAARWWGYYVLTSLETPRQDLRRGLRDPDHGCVLCVAVGVQGSGYDAEAIEALVKLATNPSVHERIVRRAWRSLAATYAARQSYRMLPDLRERPDLQEWAHKQLAILSGEPQGTQVKEAAYWRKWLEQNEKEILWDPDLRVFRLARHGSVD